MDEPADNATPTDDREKLERVEKLVSMAKGVVQVLVKTIRATKMYLPNNPVYRKFRDELKEKLEQYFEEEDLLSFTVRKFELEFLEQQVYHNPDKEDNIALMFFKDGVREFSFHNGVTPEETGSFIDILKFEMKDRELDDDLVTLMWEKDFGNISYTVADEVTEEEAAEEEAFLSFEAEGGEAADALRKLETLAARPAQSGPAPETGAPEAAGPAPWSGHSDFPSIIMDAEPGGVDYESIRGTYATPDDLTLLTELTDIFYEILITEKDEEVFILVSDSLSSALGIFIGRGDMALATLLLMKVHELVDTIEDPERKARLDAIAEKACSEDSVSKVGEFIEDAEQDFADMAGSYLRQLDKRAVGPLVRLLGVLTNSRSRKMVMDIIVELCGGDGSPVTGFLDHKDWFVVRNIAIMLGRVGDQRTVARLAAVMTHENPKVRREVIAALAAIKGPEAERRILEAFSDTERLNRILAYRSLVEIAPEKAYRALTEMVSQKQFGAKEFEEMKEAYIMLGRAGGKNAVGFLAERFRKRGMFGRKKKDRLRACVAYGLAATGADEAYDLLGTETGSKSEELSEACRQGIERLDRQRGNS